jgi:hypothetical protein
MRSIIPVVSVILALVAAGSIAYIASELIKDVSTEDEDEATNSKGESSE